jgi:type IV pilus assembly protein PilX
MALVFLVMLTVLGLSSMQGSTLEERMSGNLRDRNVALQAAELALRDAERDLAALKSDGTTFCKAGDSGCRPTGTRASVDTVASPRQAYWIWTPALRTSWTPTCLLGQCDSSDNTAASHPVWDDAQADWSPQTGSSGTNPTVAYGTYTGATAIPGLAAQPRYIMEIFPACADGSCGSQVVFFRITVRAVGQNPKTVVVLQSVSAPN